jgi:transcriptional regulator with XRE-family HTH domain
MQTHEKLRLMRQHKKLTQEKLAEKLDWAVNSYRKIEQGKASIKLEKLQQIANVMGVNVEELMNSDDKTVLNFAENCTQSNLAHCTVYLTETQCVHELEKARLLLQERDKENENLKKQILQLEEINALLKKNQ